jgi:hypothetical protein
MRRGKGKAGKGGKRREKGREGWKGRGGVAAGKGESDLGLGMILFISFFKPVRFGPVQSV